MLVKEMFTCKDQRKKAKKEQKFRKNVDDRLTRKPTLDGFDYDHSGTANGERGAREK